MKETTLTIVLMAILPFGAAAAAETVPFNADGWQIDAQDHRFEDYKGYQALYMERGVATVKGASLENGIIEFDIALPEERGFSGVIWRILDAGNYEELYLRHHLSGQPDANQYTPVFNGLSGWQLYAGPHFATPTEYRANEWMHVKVAISGSRADIYIDSDGSIDSDRPVLHVPRLKRSATSGGIGLKTNFAAVRFANFSYEALDDVELVGVAAEVADAPGDLLTTWEVSRPFPSKRVVGKLELGEDAPDMGWQRLDSEWNGITNLARVATKTPANDTVFARFVLESDREQSKILRFGFSDQVHLYLNGHLLFAGNDTYVSRDYRFLGTVGLFDEVVLPLRRGRNEVRFAVTEVFGGWGVLGQIEDRAGIRVVD